MKSREAKQIDLEKIKIKIVTDYFERADVETILSRHHPLGAKKAMGRRLCYAASYRGAWIAVLLFDAPVKKNKQRESQIGWSAVQRDNRREHIANNSRFLIVPGSEQYKNAASKILSLVTNRISDDWLKRYGVPLLAVETYVDPNHNENTGACYSAAGWENLGYSSGYQAYGEERTHRKWYFLKALHKDSYAALSSDIPHALLTGVKNVSGKSNNNYVLDASKFKIEDLQKDLVDVKDPRGKQGQRYKFVPFLSLCICATISGYTEYRQIADWIEKIPAPERVRYGMPGDMSPDEGTVGDLICAIDPVEFQTVLNNWLLKTYKKEVPFSTVAIDGKALRATSSNATEQKGFLNVFASELGIVIDQVPTLKGGGEKSAAQKVLASDIDLTGKIILADAMHTDKKMIQAVEKKTLGISLRSKTIRNL